MSRRTKIKELLASTQTGMDVTVKGWVRTFRNNQFIALNDGSTNNNIQIVVDFENTDAALLKRITTGAAISVVGELVPSLGKGQTVEVKAKEIEILGDSSEKYPIQPKKHSLEFLREYAHLRFRTNTFGSIFRVRNSLAFAVHQFFQERGFVYLHTPIITGSDAEGAGETFKVTSLNLLDIPFRSQKLNQACDKYYNRLIDFITQKKLSHHVDEINHRLKSFDKNYSFEKLVKSDITELNTISGINNKLLKSVGVLVKKIDEALKEDGFHERAVVFSRTLNAEKTKIRLAEWFVKEVNPKKSGAVSALFKVSKAKISSISFFNYSFVNKELKNKDDREVIFDNDFFGRATNLTVSGQLEGELGAMALSDIYTFGPTFRAENSNTTRHLAEFWMIEPEMAFFDLNDNMDLAEGLLKYVIKYALDKNKDDIEFLTQRLLDEEKQKPQNERSEMSLLEKLQFCLDNDFERLTYTEAIDILKESTPNKKKKFQYPVEGWGTDLQSEHERYLVEKHFKKPVILTDYPKEIKAFYMRQNDDGKTVRAMDILFPGIGEIVGGSQREERLEKLEQRMNEMGIPTEELWWYLDTRRFGACPHAGFGLGFERLVLFVTGMGNIRDVIPFPRFPKNAEF